ncbi:3-oxoacyl-ACP synthase III family protein [Actinomadura syzygii]|uniref:3-oxoacyl-ACP synthase III family protein n=1 Tax=Actinomadura syzygii TaxID=1427538 RepID=A0A5D0UIR7_9ACTN|nr:3-oxoacyl-ACP synthase III family protein [Actinomadura syzygii]TYC17505.1 3-oxoacyl-ACP synthase III family protein [Actinomadura syzygii]
MTVPDIRLRSVATTLPGPAVDNATLTRRFSMPSAWETWIDDFVGTRTRHFAVDLGTGEVRHTLTDLGAAAGRKALDDAGVDPGEVDLMVLATSSPDMLMPATVNMVADRLGIDGLPAYQLQSGCTGAVQAIDVACQLLRAGRGRTALVLGADSCAKHLDVTVDPATLTPAEQINGVLFGDGAGAMVLSTEPVPGRAVLRGVLLKLAGLGRAPGQTVAWYGERGRTGGDRPIGEDYKAIEESVPVLAAEALDELLDDLDWKESDLDYLLPPQLSGRMTARIVERLDVPGAHEVSCVAETGNTGNALPFFQLERALPRMVAGDRAAAVAIESSKWIKAGFALEKV